MNNQRILSELIKYSIRDLNHQQILIEDLLCEIWEEWVKSYLMYKQAHYFVEDFVVQASEYCNVDKFYLYLGDTFSSDGSEFVSTSTLQEAILNAYVRKGALTPKLRDEWLTQEV